MAAVTICLTDLNSSFSPINSFSLWQQGCQSKLSKVNLFCVKPFNDSPWPKECNPLFVLYHLASLLSYLPNIYLLHGVEVGYSVFCESEKWKWRCSVMSDSLRPHGLWPTRLLCPWDSPGKSTGVGCHYLLQGIFPTQGSNPGLPHCRQMLYRLSHQGRLVS